MRRTGGGIALAAGILGIFAPFLDGFFALAFSKYSRPIEAEGLILCVGVIFPLLVLAFAMLTISKRHRFFGIALIAVCLIGVFVSQGILSRIVLSIAMLGGALSLIGNRRKSEW